MTKRILKEDLKIEIETKEDLRLKNNKREKILKHKFLKANLILQLSLSVQKKTKNRMS